MKVKQIIIGIILILVGIFIDQITKYISFRNFTLGKDNKLIPGIFRISLVKNEGSAWGMFSGQLWFLILITIVALGFFIFIAKDFDLKERSIFSVSFILIVTGTLGNFIDRIYFGYVRDFLTFDFFRFPSFNFADMCLTIGVFFLAFDILFGETGKKWS